MSIVSETSESINHDLSRQVALCSSPGVRTLLPLIERVRTDVTAVKKRDGGQAWTDEPLTLASLIVHVSGGPARGVCPIKEADATTRVALLDFDSHKGETPWAEMAATAERVMEALHQRGILVSPWRSSGGHGIHLIMLWDEPQDCYTVRQVLAEALADCNLQPGAGGVKQGQVEVFPKQNRVEQGGKGSQFILPLAGKSVPLLPLLGLDPMERDAQASWPVSAPLGVRERPVRRAGGGGPSGNLALLASALAYLPNEDLDYDTWWRRIAIIHYEGQGSDEAYQLAVDYSAQSTRKFVQEFLDNKVWPYLDFEREDPVRLGSLKRDARAAGWQEPISADDFEVIVEGEAAPAPEAVEPPVVESAGPPALAQEADDAPPLASDEAEPVPFPDPFRGPMQALVSAALKASTKAQPELCTLAALIGMAGALPGCVHLPSGMRLNLYGCGVAPTGAGKDLPRTAAELIARDAGGKLIGRPASGQGLEDALTEGRGMLASVDEVAHLFEAVASSRAPAYLIELAGNLLRLFSASGSVYQTRVRAASKTAPEPRAIANPCFSLLGFATPEKLGKALNETNVTDGLLGRFLFAWGRPRVLPRRISARLVLPKAAADAAEKVGQVVGAAAMAGPIEISITPEAEAMLGRLLVEFSQRADDSTPFAQALLTRSVEKLERVAGVLAVWDTPLQPVMRAEHVEWAAQAVRASDAAVLHFTAKYMHEGEVQGDALRVLEILRRILAGDIKPTKANQIDHLKAGRVPYALLLKASKLDSARCVAALRYLMDLGDVREQEVKGPAPARGPHKMTRVLVLAED
mgnify:CR=1 FL=1